MGILFGFKADDITTKVVDTETEANSTVVITTPLTVDPISDAVNNVRFAFNGFAADGASAVIEMRTRTTFKFQIPEESRITVHGHLTHIGLLTATGQGSTGFLDLPGIAQFQLTAKMRVRVRGANNEIVFTRSSGERLLFGRLVTGTTGTRTVTDLVSATLLEQFLTVSPPDNVLPEHRIFVRIQYNIFAFALGGAEFVVDFDPAGAGLNVPMVVVNY